VRHTPCSRTRSAAGRGTSTYWPASLVQSALVCRLSACLTGTRHRPAVAALKRCVVFPAKGDRPGSRRRAGLRGHAHPTRDPRFPRPRIAARVGVRRDGVTGQLRRPVEGAVAYRIAPRGKELPSTLVASLMLAAFTKRDNPTFRPPSGHRLEAVLALSRSIERSEKTQDHGPDVPPKANATEDDSVAFKPGRRPTDRRELSQLAD
jgi:hypothetical protein